MEGVCGGAIFSAPRGGSGLEARSVARHGGLWGLGWRCALRDLPSAFPGWGEMEKDVQPAVGAGMALGTCKLFFPVPLHVSFYVKDGKLNHSSNSIQRLPIQI